MEADTVSLEFCRSTLLCKHPIKEYNFEYYKWTVVDIKLQKYESGFGFVLSSQPTYPLGFSKYVKLCVSDNCLKSGLKPGDRLFMIGEHSVFEMNKRQVCDSLKEIKIGEFVDFKFGRFRENIFTDRATFLIPFSETQSAGLGVCLKTLNDDSSKIYIASILRGGALWKDGRAKEGDQILSINNISIENDESVEIALQKLTLSIQSKSPFGNYFSLMINRNGNINCGNQETNVQLKMNNRDYLISEFYKSNIRKQSIKSLRQFLTFQEGWKRI